MGELEFVVSDGPDKGKVFAFAPGGFLIGSAVDCAVRLLAGDVAPRHAEVLADAVGGWWIRDLSGGKLLLDGKLASEGVLRPGCFLRLGCVELALRESDWAGPHGTIARGVTPTPRVPVPTSRFGDTVRRPSTSPGLETVEVEFEAPGQRAAPSTVLPPGSIIDGRYEVLEKLAEGGMGEVYRAQHVELGKPLAIKVMRPELSDDPEFVARFKREAISAGRIGQLNIIDVSDFGRTTEGRFYFVMEYLDGVTVTHLLRSGEGLPVQRVMNLVSQVVRALAAAHAAGIVHRDLKPDNIMVLQRPGQPDLVKVLDFGIAKVLQGKAAGGQTAVGMVVGTPQYMAPEQAQGLNSDTRTDIYALGLIFYELLRGRPAFEAETPSMLMIKQVTEPPPRFPGSLSSQIPPALERMVFKMLEKSPEARPQSMEEVLAELERSGGRAATVVPPPAGVASGALASPPVVTSAPPPPPAPPVPSARSRAPVVGAVVLVVLGVAAVTLRGFDSAAPPPPAPVQPAPPRVEPAAAQVAAPVLSPRVESAPPQAAEPAPPAPAEAPAVNPSQAAPAQAPTAGRPTLQFTTTPVTATVLEADLVLGVTPFHLTRDAGTVMELTFRANGHADVQMKVRFENDQVFQVTLQPVVAPPVPPRKPASAVKPTGHDLKEIDL
jgi:hypothetical protein